MRANSQKINTSTDFKFTNPNFVRHNIEYQSSMTDMADCADEYDPSTKDGISRLAYLARFESKTLPCGTYTLIG